ncbi:MAG: putative DNA-binding domain-containing protein [Gammaproteobacteria bacterium]|nr:putative DNA-binding domain-containing protein [Gammaproteobacteria bacterium]
MAGRDELAAGWIEERGLAGADRLAIYRHAIEATRTRTLTEEFPTVHALVGAEYFEHLARQYGGRFPSRSGNLQDFGADFPVFLESFVATAGLGYLPDCARLDWLRAAAALAADAEPVDADGCAAAAAIEPARLLVRLHPSVRVCRSAYGVLAIHRWCETPAEAVPSAEPLGTQVLLWRDGGEVAMADIEGATAEFIERLGEGTDVAAAAAAGEATDSHFNFAVALGDLLARRLIVGFDIKEASK